MGGDVMPEKTILQLVNESIKSMDNAIDELAISCEEYSICYDKYISSRSELKDSDILKDKLKEAVIKVINDEIR